MKIIIGENAGFCYGVKRAVEGTLNILSNGKKTFCFGELVHNKIVINDLEEKGAIFVDNLNEVTENVVIRAHGVSKDIYDYMKKKKINFFDYTCPNVLNIHSIAEEYAKKGYFIFLLGDSKHPENIGTISFCGNKSFIIENETCVNKAIENFNITKINKLLIIAQTTFSVKAFNNIVNEIKSMIDGKIELVIKNTICNATEIRQEETEELSKEVDFMIIIGGKNSSNTKKLYDIASLNCKHTICIENKDELDLKKIKGFNKIGIMAGASTPRSSIDEVKEEIEKINVKV